VPLQHPRGNLTPTADPDPPALTPLSARQLVCGKRIAAIITGKGAATRIPWCDFSRRRILQLISAFRLTPDNIETQVCPSPPSSTSAGSSECNVLDLIMAELHCHHPSNPQYAPAVRPRLVRKIRKMMGDLDEAGAVVAYRMSRGGERRVYWPPWTKRWCRPDWDGDYGGTVAAEAREQLERVAEGWPVPGFVSEEEDVARGPEPPRMETRAMPTLTVPVPRPFTGTSAEPRPEAGSGWDGVSAFGTESTVSTSASSAARLAADLSQYLPQPQQQMQRQPPNRQFTTPTTASPSPSYPQQAPPGQGTSKSAKRRLKRRLREGQPNEGGGDAEMTGSG